MVSWRKSTKNYANSVALGHFWSLKRQKHWYLQGFPLAFHLFCHWKTSPPPAWRIFCARFKRVWYKVLGGARATHAKGTTTIITKQEIQRQRTAAKKKKRKINQKLNTIANTRPTGIAGLRSSTIYCPRISIYLSGIIPSCEKINHHFIKSSLSHPLWRETLDGPFGLRICWTVPARNSMAVQSLRCFSLAVHSGAHHVQSQCYKGVAKIRKFSFTQMNIISYKSPQLGLSGLPF